ncbi:hypothetical protein [Flavobacterium sp. H122]|uniref:hypothetical protein n=1 Tax=Flavobacterium sp. H122 TaxID=2529860 RepID=UPI0010A9BAAB|nr:hypothetical protein [Flavobacterium sp. H122]
MSHFSRKDFIRLTSLSFIATLLPVSEMQAITRVFSSNLPTTKEGFEEAKKLAKQAKVFFYKKEYQKAIDTYLRCIELAPNYIQFYDSLSNVYGATNNLVASAELFKQGLLKNQKKGLFYDRAARSLQHLELSQSKQAEAFLKKNQKNASLFDDAQELYKKAIELEGAKKYLVEGQLHLAKKKEAKLKLALKKDKAQLKNEKKEHYKESKAQYRQLKSKVRLKSDTELELLIKQLDTKKRPELFVAHEKNQQEFHVTKQKKRYLRILWERYKKDKTKNIDLAKRIFDLDPSDSLAICHLKKAYQDNNKYFDLIKERQRFAEAHPSVYSYLGVVDAIQDAYDKKQVTQDSLANGVSIADKILSTYSLTEKTAVDVIDKLAKLYIAQGNYQEATSVIQTILNELNTNSPATVNKLIYRYASIYFAKGDYLKVKEILRFGLNEEEGIKAENKTIQQIHILAKNKQKESFRHKEPLYILAYQAHKSLGENSQAKEIVQKIAAYDPKNLFVQKRN